VAGALGAGIVADALGLTWALEAVALLTVVSGVVFAIRGREALPGASPVASA
jgi:hypothetical protein